MPTLRVNMVFAHDKFMAGDFLIGKVLVDSSDPDTVIQAMTADIKGTGRTGWVNIHTDKIFEKETTYWSANLMLSSQQSLTPGRHHFPIQVQIPEECPSSYESQYGVIRYEMRVRLEANTEQASAAESFPFYVITRSFLTQLPSNLLNPIDYTDEIDFTCCTLPFGTVSIKVHLPRTAFVVGEVMEPRVWVRNGTRKQLKEFTLLLISKSQYEARSRYEHVDEKKLAEAVVDHALLGAVPSRCSQDLEACVLRIPSDAAPTQKYSKDTHHFSPIITIHYVLRLTALPGIEFEVPLMITSAHSETTTLL